MKRSGLLLAVLCFFFTAQSQFWLIDGNTGTNPKIHFIGNKDDNPLLFRINNKFAGEIDSVWGLTFFGFGAGRSASGANTVAIGYKALSANSTGFANTALGASAFAANTNGQQGVAVGYAALINNTTGWYNTATGASALFYNTTGCCNVANGFGVMTFNNGSYNTANGYEALYMNQTGVNNTATGAMSLMATRGDNNTGAGYQSLTSNATGIWNTAAGAKSLAANYGGNYNTAIGGWALAGNSYSWYNTALGYHAATNFDMGWNNTMLGAYCDVNSNNLYNCLAVGEAVTCTASSQARIGNSSTVSIGGYVGWSNISDGRIKKNIQDNVPGLDFINKLKPVTYNLDLNAADKLIQKPLMKDQEGKTISPSQFETDARKQKEQIVYTGFIAQDVEKAAKELNYDFSGVDAAKNDKDLYGLRYAEFVVPLVKAVQELSVKNNEMKDQINELKKISADQKKLNDDLLERIKRLESSFITKK